MSAQLTVFSDEKRNGRNRYSGSQTTDPLLTRNLVQAGLVQLE